MTSADLTSCNKVQRSSYKRIANLARFQPFLGTHVLLFYVLASLVPDLVCKERASLSQYSGNVSVTDGSRTCQRWSDQTPHAHPFNSSQYFPFDESVEDAVNYCRNVGGDDLPWCYTNDTRVRWQYCYEQICEGITRLLVLQ